ncbi:hypothetical protein NPX13_g6966 [Xylaria arbuscula]|uniref:lytic cellulose monooxygenase (C4-dehydrogenating) n=1 Tax=Xylaria arbuscula TaxID=114810 RepID=A0A9W8NBG1_9PEZI|nr:hypothetical protein NPX13_g6966 [Xylaria arbuscula]
MENPGIEHPVCTYPHQRILLERKPGVAAGGRRRRNLAHWPSQAVVQGYTNAKQRFPVQGPFAIVAGLTATAHAHTVLTTLFVDDVGQGDATCVRMPLDPGTCTSPVESVDSDNMACGVDGQTPVAFTCSAPAGGKLTFQFRTWANAAQPGSLDSSHKGPCAMYAKQVHDVANDEVAGPGWIKLWDDGYDTAAKKWCTEKLIDNNGLLSFEIPMGLPSGYWVFRPELLALHEANKGDPQFYVGCAQVFVQSSNTAALKVPEDQIVSIPGHVRASEAGLTFNIYAPTFPYPLPGPKAFAVPPPKGGDVDTTGPSVPKQTQGVIPPNHIVKNATGLDSKSRITRTRAAAGQPRKIAGTRPGRATT